MLYLVTCKTLLCDRDYAWRATAGVPDQVQALAVDCVGGGPALLSSDPKPPLPPRRRRTRCMVLPASRPAPATVCSTSSCFPP